MNFLTIWIPKGILAKLLSEKAGLEKHSCLKYALVSLKSNNDGFKSWPFFEK